MHVHVYVHVCAGSTHLYADAKVVSILYLGNTELNPHLQLVTGREGGRGDMVHSQVAMNSIHKL